VVADELSSIPDIQDKHRRVLAGELKITTFRALARADRRDIHRAMRNLRPRPTLEQIARWQDHARSRLSEAADQSDWHPAASFAVVFAQRQTTDGEWERRIEVERTEVEPEQEGRTWPEWDCRETCGWMRGQLGLADAPPPEVQPPAQPGTGKRGAGGPAPRGAGARPARPGDAEPAAPPAARARGRGELRIGSVTVIDPGRQVGRMAAGAGGAPPVDVVTAGAGGAPRVDVVTAGAPAQAPPTAPAGPLRVEITIGGGRRGQEIHAVARVLPHGGPGWNPQDPVVIRGAGAASFDLSRLPEGRHEVALIAWAPDGSVAPTAVRLPELTIQPRQ
jgi:hypothetical protein